jgi:Fe-S-cluster containining protein
MKTILQKYGSLLASVDRWFANCCARAGHEIACARGCSSCCRGLFDITLLDACYLKTGFDQLEEDTRRLVLEKAKRWLEVIRQTWPGFDAPYILNIRPEADWQALMSEDDQTPCPLLSDSGECLVYDYRPMTCRLHGIPNIDLSGEHFSDEWCTRNFTGTDPLAIKELRWEFANCFQTELSIFKQFTAKQFKQSFNELDTFIPLALLMDFAGPD